MSEKSIFWNLKKEGHSMKKRAREEMKKQGSSRA
jgi:hypothetical protein